MIPAPHPRSIAASGSFVLSAACATFVRLKGPTNSESITYASPRRILVGFIASDGEKKRAFRHDRKFKYDKCKFPSIKIHKWSDRSVP